MLWLVQTNILVSTKEKSAKKEEAMKVTTKQITITAVLLAICIASQFFKNVSVYITGPVINTLILAVLSVGVGCGLILAVVTPVTAFLIAGSPIMSAIPAIIPCIMAGNACCARCGTHI